LMCAYRIRHSMKKPAAKRVEHLLTTGVKSGEPDANKLLCWSALLNQHARII
jgi:phosphodiesterase/alkaline phosphatase D-like protein